jgi:DNA polymerase I-like protein with 3'-5' exonuclease and polymerase domains
MTKESLQNVFDLETRLSPVLWDMRWNGVRFDLAGAHKLRDQWHASQEELAQSMKDMAGHALDIWAADALRHTFEAVGIDDWPTTETGKPSFTSRWLEDHAHPLARHVKQARKIAKGLQFLENMVQFAEYGKGRIHSTTNQLRSDDYGTVSGRLSMSQPSLHQIPGRDPDIGPALRTLFLPNEGEQWISADYASQEPRILMHYVKRRGLAKGHPLMDQYITDPKADLHGLVGTMMNVPRSVAKTINLGIMYGMGVTKLSQQLDVTLEKAKRLLSGYHKQFPFVGALRDVCSEKATSLHAIATLSGRRCRFNHYEPTTFGKGLPLPKDEAVIKWPNMPLKTAWTYKALNRLIQGSAADQNKAALVRVHEKHGITPLISIHDEICASGDETTSEEIVQCMTEAVHLEVPVTVDAQTAQTWGGIAK